MTDKPDVLRIADLIDSIDKATDGNVPDLYKATLAELRKLHNENFVLASGQCLEGGPWGDEGGTPYCKLKEELKRLHEVNNELVEHLLDLIAFYEEMEDVYSRTNWGIKVARAAIAKLEMHDGT